MPVLPRKALLAIAAVVEVALQGQQRPVAAKSLASRHGLPPRHLETVLQALVREGILRGVRGPRGGYQLARRIRAVPWGQTAQLVAITGWGQEEDRRRAAEVGFDHHLTKPVAAEALDRLLRSMATERDNPALQAHQ